MVRMHIEWLKAVDETIIIEAIVENIGFRGDIYKM